MLAEAEAHMRSQKPCAPYLKTVQLSDRSEEVFTNQLPCPIIQELPHGIAKSSGHSDMHIGQNS